MVKRRKISVVAKKTRVKGRKILYISDYEDGKTKLTSLQLFVVDSQDPLVLKKNKEALYIAEKERERYENMIKNPDLYQDGELIGDLKAKCFVKYFYNLKKDAKESTRGVWDSTFRHLEGFLVASARKDMPFKSINNQLIRDFRQYLLTAKRTCSDSRTLSINSVSDYFRNFKSGLKQAYYDEFLERDYSAQAQNVAKKRTFRNYLTQEEVMRLANTPFEDDSLRRASIFSILTGLRFSDIEKMTWGSFKPVKKGYFSLKFVQKKTGDAQENVIPSSAYEILGKPGDPNKKVFKKLALYSPKLQNWVKNAGIDKKITFHCFRRTFATLNLQNGVNIYVISGALGHSSIKTTESYLKGNLDMKIEASEHYEISINHHEA